MKTCNLSTLNGTPSSTAIGCCICTFLAPYSQSVFMSAMLVILALGLPLFTSAAPLLLNTSGNTMKVFIVVVFFHSSSFFFVTFPRIFRLTFPAPNPQPVRTGTILAKLIPVFTFLTFTALLHFFLSIVLTIHSKTRRSLRHRLFPRLGILPHIFSKDKYSFYKFP